MNTNPKAKTVLCYGDSNTRGSHPDARGRYSADKRWTGILQKGLGDTYYVIEEGRGGRTTDVNHPLAPGRNGRKYLQPCLETHNPLDIVIIMLGTNDLKQIFQRTAEDIGDALEGLLDDIESYAVNSKGQKPKVVVISPVHVAEGVVETEHSEKYDGTAHDKSMQLAAVYKRIAVRRGLEFFDASTVAGVGKDGIHIDEAGHKALGEALTKVVLSV